MTNQTLLKYLQKSALTAPQSFKYPPLILEDSRSKGEYKTYLSSTMNQLCKQVIQHNFHWAV